MKTDGLLNNQYRQIFDLAKNYEHGQRPVRSPGVDKSRALEVSKEEKESSSPVNQSRSPLFV